MSEEHKKEDFKVTEDLIQQLLQMQMDAVLEKPVSYPVTVDDPSLLPEGKTIDHITITPLKVRTVMEITPKLMLIDKDDLDKITVKKGADFDPSAPEIFNKYHDLILDIICIGIRNKKGDSPAWFKEFLAGNFTWQELHIFLNAIFFRMNSKSFQSSIILAKRMSPIDDRGIIALQNQMKKNLSTSTAL